MSRRATYVQASGVVVDGRIRDLAEHWDTGLRIYARGTGTTAPGGMFPYCHLLILPSEWKSLIDALFPLPHHHAEVCHPSKLNIPVTLNPTSSCLTYAPTIHPGDWIHGDLDGVVRIPRELVEQVIEKAKDIGSVDAKIAEDVEKGVMVAEAMAKWRKGGSR